MKKEKKIALCDASLQYIPFDFDLMLMVAHFLFGEMQKDGQGSRTTSRARHRRISL